MTSLRNIRAVRILTAVALAAVASTATAAGAYPERPITLVVPYPPGGTTDIAARTMAHAMESALGQTIVVENKPGAGGNVGMGAVARAKPDGYTIGMGTIGTQTINEFLYKDMAFDPKKDFAPIALVVKTPNVIAVKADSPIHDLKDVIAAAKKRGADKLTYASPGVGSSVHLTGAYLEQAAGIDMLHVPFKGVAGSLPALIGGQVDILMDNLPSTLSHLKDGSKVRAIAVTSAQRSPSLPDVPTVMEAGIPDFDLTAWFALYAPAGTPAEVLETLTKSARTALQSKELKAKFVSLGAEPGTLFGSEVSTFEAGERARWSKLIADRHIAAR